MKFALLALVACASLAVAAAQDAERKPRNIYEKEGHLNDMRERLGHFGREQPFIDLYKQYATAFVYPKHKHERAKDDYRNYMPSGAECLPFFKNLRMTQYKIEEFNELIKLDACLGYLYDSDNHDLDKETSEQDKAHIQTLKEDETLSALYHQTKINELEPEAKGCVADMLLSNILARHQYRQQECNNHFLQMYLQFAECQEGVIKPETRADDSYLKLIYAILKARVQKCFNVEITHINSALRDAFGKDKTLRAKLALKGLFGNKASSQKVQQAERMWPTPIVKLLAAVQNTKNQINLREVHQLVRGFYLGDKTLIDRFTKNIALYADEQIDPKPLDAGNEADAINKYRDLVDRTCQFFRSSDSESQYDYSTPLIRMVELLNHEDLFDITAQQFVKDMLTQAHETAPVYLSVTACNLLTFTEGTVTKAGSNGVKSYTVQFVPDTSRMPKWPDAGYF